MTQPNNNDVDIVTPPGLIKGAVIEFKFGGCPLRGVVLEARRHDHFGTSDQIYDILLLGDGEWVPVSLSEDDIRGMNIDIIICKCGD